MGCYSSKNVKLAHTQQVQPRKLTRRNSIHNESTPTHHNRASPLRHVPSTHRTTDHNDYPLTFQSVHFDENGCEKSDDNNNTNNITGNYKTDNILDTDNVNDNVKRSFNDSADECANRNFSRSVISKKVKSNQKETKEQEEQQQQQQQQQQLTKNNVSIVDNVYKHNEWNNNKPEWNKVKSISKDLVINNTSNKAINKSSTNFSNNKLKVNANKNNDSNNNSKENKNCFSTTCSAVGLQENNINDAASESNDSEESVLSLSSLELSGSFRSPVMMLDNGDCRLESAGVMQPSPFIIANSIAAKLRSKSSSRARSPHSNDA